jgi:hypothetical protein
MSQDKFLVFLESLTTEENKALIEAVTEGYKSILETNVGKFLSGDGEREIANRIDRSINIIDDRLDRAGLNQIILKHNQIVEAITENITQLTQENYDVMRRTYMNMLNVIRKQFPVGGDYLIDIEEQIDFLLNNLRKLVI